MHFWHTCSPENVPDGNNYDYFRLHKHVYLKPKTAMYITAWQIPGLSRNKVIFQDFPGPGNFPIKIPGLSRIFLEAWEPCMQFIEAPFIHYIALQLMVMQLQMTGGNVSIGMQNIMQL